MKFDITQHNGSTVQIELKDEVGTAELAKKFDLVPIKAINGQTHYISPGAVSGLKPSRDQGLDRSKLLENKPEIIEDENGEKVVKI